MSRQKYSDATDTLCDMHTDFSLRWAPGLMCTICVVFANEISVAECERTGGTAAAAPRMQHVCSIMRI